MGRTLMLYRVKYCLLTIDAAPPNLYNGCVVPESAVRHFRNTLESKETRNGCSRTTRLAVDLSGESSQPVPADVLPPSFGRPRPRSGHRCRYAPEGDLSNGGAVRD